ncbi:MAG: precorrin-6y C5,15-methyltransferase (decarboxylating) subunit CbiE [Magnetococcales bacterium]|nr:precorrin-6y C5,15-methyltransferase (decarboxylating) subunit CbiE [Magnetococcales bacterium]
MDNPCWIIGVHDGGPALLTSVAKERISQGDLILGDARFLERFSPLFAQEAKQRSFSGQIRALPGWISVAQQARQRVVLLATGDPLFHGIAGYLNKKLPRGSIRVQENVSTLQIAFARLSLPWHNARLLSVHAKDGGEWSLDSSLDHPLYPLFQALQHAETIALLTSPANNPHRIARMLQQSGLEDHFLLTIAQQLTTPQEQVAADLSPSQALNTPFKEPNVVILQRIGKTEPHTAREPVLGIKDSRFLPHGQTTGLITKQEIRAISLAALSLQPDSTLWDIGAGSGSVGLEAARLCPEGWVYAIEKNPGRLQTIRENQAKLQIANYQLLAGLAPQGLAEWPDPDAVFIGGSGGNLAELILLAQQRLTPKGRLVMNFITLENLNQALTTLKTSTMDWHVTQVQINRSKPILEMNRLVPESPVWIVTAHKEGA